MVFSLLIKDTNSFHHKNYLCQDQNIYEFKRKKICFWFGMFLLHAKTNTQIECKQNTATSYEIEKQQIQN